jgi:UDPglucose 6-dehydrogenase
MKQICVVGVGYVGLVTAACFADLGNHVIALDVDERRVENLKKGIMYDPARMKELGFIYRAIGRAARNGG